MPSYRTVTSIHTAAALIAALLAGVAEWTQLLRWRLRDRRYQARRNAAGR